MQDVKPLVGKQRVAVSLNQAAIMVYEGAVRSSKSVCCDLAYLDFIRNGPPGNLLAVGKTERTLKRNVFDPLTDMLGAKRCKVVTGSGEAWVLGRRVYMLGANDERAQDKLRGLSLVGALADEASTYPKSFMDMLLTRMSDDGSKMWITSNPEGPFHWLMTDFLRKARLHLKRDGSIETWPCQLCGNLQCPDECEGDGRLDLYRFSFELDDNPTLSQRFKRQLRAGLSGLYYRRWILGEWCLAEGLVYDMFDPDRHILSGPLPVMAHVVGVGVDVGTTNPTAALMLGVQAADDRAGTPARLVLMREYRAEQKTDLELSAGLRQWMAADRPAWVAVDPSAASLKLQMHNDGLSNLVNADNEVLDGIRLLSSLLKAGQLVIHESCTELIRELSLYSWDAKAAERGEDKPIKADDHSCDAARYAVTTTHAVWRRWLPSPLDTAA